MKVTDKVSSQIHFGFQMKYLVPGANCTNIGEMKEQQVNIIDKESTTAEMEGRQTGT